MFTNGDAMMVAINAPGINVFTTGNWDNGYAPPGRSATAN
jgi:hypothetical protein